jgi:hypothetical protein
MEGYKIVYSTRSLTGLNITIHHLPEVGTGSMVCYIFVLISTLKNSQSGQLQLFIVFSILGPVDLITKSLKHFVIY